MSNFFYNLTPEVIIKSLERCGLEPTGHCMALNSYENRVYDLMLEDESHVVAKFYRPGRWSREQIQEEHDFLFQLQEDEIPVCAPLRFKNGSSIEKIEDLYYAVWPRTGGRGADELTDEEIQILGRLCARIHNRGAAGTAPHRIELTGLTYGLESLDYLLTNSFIPDHCRQRYSTAVNEIVELYEELSRDVPFHRIHGDCHLGNLLNGREGLFFLDFDDFLNGPAVQDLWMLVPARDSVGLHQRELFLEAYRQFRDFNTSWLRLIEPLRGLRYIRYAAWIAKRWEDPAFPSAFPHFGTDQYWENETSDLEELLDYIHSTDNDLPEGLKREVEQSPDEELSNKDFFWDWEE